MPFKEEEVATMMEEGGGELTDEQMASVLDEGLELGTGDNDGDQPTPDQDPEPDQDASPAEVKPEEEPAADGEASKVTEEGGEQDPVLMAKDGVHTIDYQKLVDARDDLKDSKEQTQHWQDIAEQQGKVIAGMQPDPDSDPGTTAEDDEANAADAADAAQISSDLDFLKEDYPEAAKHIQNLVDTNKVLTDKVDGLTETVTAGAAKTQAEEHWDAVESAHPEFNAEMEDKIDKWIDTLDEFDQPGCRAAFKSGTAESSIGLIDKYLKANPGETGEGKAPDDTTAADSQAKLDAKMKAAQDTGAAPTSLSEVPGGAPVHDEVEAIRDASALNLMDRMEGQSVEDIEALMQRVL